jgi:ATP-dependent Clp protease ATP-binding subunit ClpC
VVDVEGEGPTAKFTFRGEAKPIDLPDTPPVALTVGDDEDGQGGTTSLEKK